jgi:L-lactate dehydrogenase (cytochrome)
VKQQNKSVGYRVVGDLPRRLRGVLCLDDFEVAARKHLPRPIFAYISGGVETNTALHANSDSFSDYRFVPRILRDVSQRSQAVRLFDDEFNAPFGIAPMGICALSAYRGDLVLARAAAAANIPMVMSGSSLIPMEAVAAANPHAWFQAYLPGETAHIFALIDRVANAGFKTLVITVDAPVLANRENNIRAGFSTPLKPSLRLAFDGLTRPRWLIGTAMRTLLHHGMPHFENTHTGRGAPILSASVLRDFGAKDHLSWSHLDLIRKHWHGRLVVKGILDPSDAKLAQAAGADGIIVSNHGGRQLDFSIAPLSMLAPIIAAVGKDYTVMLDSGIRRGTDVLKAMALGAKFVFVGRPFIYAAAIAGQVGVTHAVDTLSEEVWRDMALLGINDLSQIASEQVRKV